MDSVLNCVRTTYSISPAASRDSSGQASKGVAMATVANRATFSPGGLP